MPQPSTAPSRFVSGRAIIAVLIAAALVIVAAAALGPHGRHGLNPRAILAGEDGTSTATPSASATASGTATPTATQTPTVIGVPPIPSTPWLATHARISTFNVLGYGHTMKGGDRKGWLDGETRQRRANQIIRDNGLDIVGFQEMEQPQINVFLAEMGSAYALWPGNSYTGKAAVNVKGNSIAWRTDEWTAIATSYYNAPYFKGMNVKKPIVLLQNNATGQRLFVSNTHNPANTFGNAQHLRNQSVDIQATKFNALRAANPTTPMVFTGDMNDRDKFFCRFTKASPMRAVNGGIRTPSTCTLPKSPQIDWIMTTTDVQLNGYQSLRTPFVKKTTDHPVIWADATIQSPLAQAAGIKRVVVLAVDGLPSSAISGAKAGLAPHLNSLATSAASTFNARTPYDARGVLPNLMSVLTGRPVSASNGGTGVTFAADRPTRKRFRTFTTATGAYINTIFDTVHNQGGSTSFLTSDPNSAILMRSADAGLPDSQGVDYGRDKLTVASIRKDDLASTRVLAQQLTSSPRTLSVLQLASPRIIGDLHGYDSVPYRRSVQRVDRRIGSIVSTIRSNPALRDSTAIVVTSTTGGEKQSVNGTTLATSQVPLIVAGPGITMSDLYELNPEYVDPGATRPDYAAAQPLRNSAVANIVTTLLGYPLMPTPTSFGQALRLFH